MRHAKKQKSRTQTQKKKEQATETIPDEAQMLDLLDRL